MRDRQEMNVNGILLVDKPKEWTSHDVCAFVRKRFHIKKVGHAGTLDPMATGLLVVLLGKATKQSMLLSASDKSYEGVLELGVQTDSHDRSGKVLREAPVGDIKLEALREMAKRFTGDILQTPPMVSALKHNGVRLYKLARKGQEVPRDARPVTVHKFNIQSIDGKFVSFASHVSKGTYVRTLVHDFGEALGCLATLADLRRTRSGAYEVEQSVTVDALREMKPEELVPRVLPMLPSTAYACSQ